MIFGTPRVSSVFIACYPSPQRGFLSFSEGALFKWCRSLASWPFLRCFQAILTLFLGHSYVASWPFLQYFYGILTRPQFLLVFSPFHFYTEAKMSEMVCFYGRNSYLSPTATSDFWGFRHQKDAKRVKQTGSVTPSNLLSYWFSAIYKTTDYRITGLHPKLCPLPPKSSIISFFMIIYKYLYI